MKIFWAIIDDEGKPRGAFLTSKEAEGERKNIAMNKSDIYDEVARVDWAAFDKVLAWEIIKLKRVKK